MFRNAVDSDTGTIVARVAVPAGAVQVTSAPPGAGMKWDAATGAWIADPDYVAPRPPVLQPAATAILDLLVRRGVITEADKDQLLGQ